MQKVSLFQRCPEIEAKLHGYAASSAERYRRGTKLPSPSCWACSESLTCLPHQRGGLREMHNVDVEHSITSARATAAAEARINHTAANQALSSNVATSSASQVKICQPASCNSKTLKLHIPVRKCRSEKGPLFFSPWALGGVNIPDNANIKSASFGLSLAWSLP